MTSGPSVQQQTGRGGHRHQFAPRATPATRPTTQSSVRSEQTVPTPLAAMPPAATRRQTTPVADAWARRRGSKLPRRAHTRTLVKIRGPANARTHRWCSTRSGSSKRSSRNTTPPSGNVTFIGLGPAPRHHCRASVPQRSPRSPRCRARHRQCGVPYRRVETVVRSFPTCAATNVATRAG